jgi:hypothetical protein
LAINLLREPNHCGCTGARMARLCCKNGCCS